VGDSFTFGDQVKNSDTWSTCIAQQTRLDVWNGGVFGYGAAQAILRAERDVAIHEPFDIIIWSITVDSNFDRDQLSVRSSFSKPYIATVEGETMAVPPGNFDSSTDFMWLLGYSVIRQRHLLPIRQEEGDFFYNGRYKVRGEHAAEIKNIIDFSMQRFAGINGTKTKSILLQDDPWIFSERDLDRTNEDESLLQNIEKNIISKLLIRSIRFMFLKRGVNYGLATRTLVIIRLMGIRWFVMRS
jgi:hypothetical protein